jgi:hypothetical protein
MSDELNKPLAVSQDNLLQNANWTKTPGTISGAKL